MAVAVLIHCRKQPPSASTDCRQTPGVLDDRSCRLRDKLLIRCDRVVNRADAKLQLPRPSLPVVETNLCDNRVSESAALGLLRMPMSVTFF